MSFAAITQALDRRKDTPMVGGFLTHHMAMHIVAMNMVAPLCALLLPAPTRRAILPPGSLAATTVLQLVLLWGWHAPAVLATATSLGAVMALMHVSLFASAIWFWCAIIDAVQRGNWGPLWALLVTGKLFCLLGLLLAFAPRALYARSVCTQSCTGVFGASVVADQQLAGLLMLTVCPLVYVTAAIAIAGRTLRRFGTQGWTLPARTLR